jgi:hypothetical protein
MRSTGDGNYRYDGCGSLQLASIYPQLKIINVNKGINKLKLYLFSRNELQYCSVDYGRNLCPQSRKLQNANHQNAIFQSMIIFIPTTSSQIVKEKKKFFEVLLFLVCFAP